MTNRAALLQIRVRNFTQINYFYEADDTEGFVLYIICVFGNIRVNSLAGMNYMDVFYYGY